MSDGLALEDMTGLEYADDDFFGLDAIVTPEMLKESLVATLAGAGGLVLTQQLVSRIPLPEEWEPRTKMLVRAGIGLAGGMVVGRLAYNYNREASMGLIGAIAGASLASVINYFAFDTPMVGFADAEDYGLTSPTTESAMLQGGDYSSMAALSAAVTQADRRAFSGPVVNPEQLMGQDGMAAYNPYMS